MDAPVREDVIEQIDDLEHRAVDIIDTGSAEERELLIDALHHIINHIQQ